MARCAAAAPSPAPATATAPAAAPLLARQVQYGRIHGFGTYTWRTNSKYVGQWKEGKMHGHGVKTDPQGTAATVRSGARGVVAVAAAGSQSGATPACTADARSSVSLGAGNIFEGEWKEGKPVVKNGDKQAGAGPMDWLNEAVANVSANIGGNRRGEYASVSTQDDDDDDWRTPRGRH